MNKQSIAKYSYLTLFFTFLYLPLVVLVMLSFNDATRSQLWHGFTLDWYKAIFSDSDTFSIALNSLYIGIISATCASLIGTLGATALYRYQFQGKKLLNGITFLLIIIPDLLLGVALLTIFVFLHIKLGFWSLLLAHITFCIPFVIVTVYSRLSTLNKHLFEAAQDLGASDWQSFKQIFLPLLLPAIIIGWLLSFSLSIDDLVISFFVSGPDFPILPLYIYSSVRAGPTPELNALCSLLLVITVGLVCTAEWIRSRL